MEFNSKRVIIHRRENGIQPALFIIDDSNHITMVTITPNHDFYITNEGYVGERYDENGNWCKIENIEKLYDQIDSKQIGCDHHSNYGYYDIKDYDTCCTCDDFYDNEMETRFECHATTQCDNCYKNTYEEI